MDEQRSQTDPADLPKGDTEQELDDIEFESYNDDNPRGGTSSPEDKIRKLKERIAAVEKEKQEYLDGWQRAKADFVNYKKRESESKDEFTKFAREGIIGDLLPILESFDMAFANKEAWQKVDQSWRIGVEYIHSQLTGVLKDHGLTEIDPKDAMFDPKEHTAIGTVPTDDPSKDHRIAEVVQKGYALSGRSLRSPKVRIYQSGENVRRNETN